MEVQSRPGDINPAQPQRPPGAERLASPGAEPSVPPVADILAVALVRKASSDLQRTHQRTQLSRTDIVNRALSFYEFADAERHAGSELLIRRATGEVYAVKLL